MAFSDIPFSSSSAIIFSRKGTPVDRKSIVADKLYIRQKRLKKCTQNNTNRTPQ
jgi:hypothetical protein